MWFYCSGAYVLGDGEKKSHFKRLCRKFPSKGRSWSVLRRGRGWVCWVQGGTWAASDTFLSSSYMVPWAGHPRRHLPLRSLMAWSQVAHLLIEFWNIQSASKRRELWSTSAICTPAPWGALPSCLWAFLWEVHSLQGWGLQEEFWDHLCISQQPTSRQDCQ